MSFRPLFVVILLAGSAAAQSVPGQVKSPAYNQLDQASKAGMGPVADGSKSSSDGTEVVSVEKGVLLRTREVPAARRCEIDSVSGDFRPGSGVIRHCEFEPARTIKTYGDRETVRIVDREKYADSQGTKWAGWGSLIGGLIGALGFLSLLIPGVNVATGVAIGVAAAFMGAATGAVIGSVVARKDAEKHPEVFTREKNKKDEVFPH